MIEIITKDCIETILTNPEDYIDSGTDVVLCKVIEKDALNPVVIMVGQEEASDNYYFVLEDNDTVIDTILCSKKDLNDKFNYVIKKAKNIA